MNATKRIYYDDSYATDFRARVVSVNEIGDDKLAVMLDATAFYPTGGGQPHDTGTIDNARVLDCIEDETSGVIQHIVAMTNGGAAFTVGSEIVGVIDGKRRFEIMQQHTAQHILSRVLLNLFDAETRGFRIFAQTAEIDVALDSPTEAKLAETFALANQIVWQNRPVRPHLDVSAEQLAGMNLRKQPARTDRLRVVEIADFDWNACGGTHVHNTGEIGAILLRSHERAKGMTRIEYVAGVRALRDYTNLNQATSRAAALAGTGRDEIEQTVARLIDENKQGSRHTRELTDALAAYEARDLLTHAVERTETRIIVRIFQRRDSEHLKQLAHHLTAHERRTVCLLASFDDGAARFVCARTSDIDADMNRLVRSLCARLDGRGGGRPDMAQGGGTCRDIEHLQQTLDEAAASVNPSA